MNVMEPLDDQYGTSEDEYLAIEDALPDHLKISPSDLQVGREIGRGRWGSTREAYWLGCKVAVKEISRQIAGFDSKHCSMELEVLLRIPHPNIVQLLGYVTNSSARFIVMEYMETSLSAIIKDHMRTSARPFSDFEALDIISKIALGMKFLHSRRVVHMGLTPATVLINIHSRRHYNVKIGGFTLSDITEDLSLRNCFPSVFFQAGTLSERQKAVDVGRFARICYIILTGRTPSSEDFAMQTWIKETKESRPPTNLDRQLTELICRCADENCQNRPTFSDICNLLADIQVAGNQERKEMRSAEKYFSPWTTHQDDRLSTLQEIGPVLKILPNTLSIDPADVEWRRLLGKGAYNKVYEVNWLGCTFAAKRFVQFTLSLKEELDFLIKLQHPHIARLVGLSVEDRGGWILMERMDMDLRNLIESRKQQKERSLLSSPPFRDIEAYEICHKIALGMNFLHSKGVVHRDLKASNILVQDYSTSTEETGQDYKGCFDVKITDFGVSHRIGNPNVAEKAGTGLWRAPEILKGKNDQPLTEDQLKKTDVYSYAMTCCEILNGEIPFGGKIVDGRGRPFHGRISNSDVMTGCRPKLSAHLNSKLVRLIHDCWHEDPAQRPDFPTICDVLANPYPEKLIVPQSHNWKLTFNNFCNHLTQIARYIGIRSPSWILLRRKYCSFPN